MTSGTSHPTNIKRLSASDVPLMHKLLSLFGEVFDEPQTYDNHRPDQQYLEQRLADDTFGRPLVLYRGARYRE